MRFIFLSGTRFMVSFKMFFDRSLLTSVFNDFGDSSSDCVREIPRCV